MKHRAVILAVLLVLCALLPCARRDLQALAVLAGFLMDCVLGDPAALPHPVSLIGWCISRGERLLRAVFPKTPRGELVAGGVLVAGVLALSGAVPFALLYVCGRVSPWLRFALSCVMCWQIVAAKCLRQEAEKVRAALDRHDLPGARTQVSMLVGRDTEHLTQDAVIRATVETVAENTSDGVIAPLFFLALGGPVAGFLYKAVNTMDSMVGYKNDRYLYFGRCAAKLDDLVNLIPARLAGLGMTAGAWFAGLDGKNAFRIWRRDRRNHASPNSAQTESACAGALHIQLAGDASYFGRIYHKPFIGDPDRPVQPDDISKACALMYAASVLLLALLVLFSASLRLLGGWL